MFRIFSVMFNITQFFVYNCEYFSNFCPKLSYNNKYENEIVNYLNALMYLMVIYVVIFIYIYIVLMIIYLLQTQKRMI